MITIEGQIVDDPEPLTVASIPTIDTRDCLYDAVTKSMYGYYHILTCQHLAIQSHVTGARLLVEKSMSIDATLHEQKVRTYVPLNLGKDNPFDRLFLFLDRESMLRAFSRYNRWSRVKE
jgi:hypothetical protein